MSWHWVLAPCPSICCGRLGPSILVWKRPRAVLGQEELRGNMETGAPACLLSTGAPQRPHQCPLPFQAPGPPCCPNWPPLARLAAPQQHCSSPAAVPSGPRALLPRGFGTAPPLLSNPSLQPHLPLLTWAEPSSRHPPHPTPHLVSFLVPTPGGPTVGASPPGNINATRTRPFLFCPRLHLGTYGRARCTVGVQSQPWNSERGRQTTRSPWS